MRVFAAVFLSTLIAASPALAQWQVRTSGTTASAWVRNDDGTSLALNCAGAEEGRLRMDLTVTPTDAPGGDGFATFQVGGFALDVATEPYGPEGQRLQILRIDIDYFDDQVTELRTQLKRGAVLSLPSTEAFQSVTFPLRGSGTAVTELEAACANVWEIARRIRGD
ncbi:hypothetical protein KUL25_09910 [Rhodobacteraceae bacterium N5(2021)]|uniref:Uncharacterized protein n=1 Tax=Gymnodinialimonas phycosphaerae TaxID=2841589 RepID=A0A975TYH0_9RHOB|nr:hypothetical protein [Gymnodinialimonas phycosphaerae]MBY4893078.1 hypothetical protein [Gymnodinialimonas phycosphaerae]